jgi:hypothetical protein
MLRWRIRDLFLFVLALFAAILPSIAHADCKDGAGIPIACLTLEPALRKIFTIDHCEAISGLTCKIHYNGKNPLPSEVFYSDYDDHGRLLCRKPSRLIYPPLRPGETGVATFLDHCPAMPARIVLKGKWSDEY